MTEPDTGSDISNTKTKFQKVDGGYLITGKKCFITNATISEHLVVFASTQNAQDRRNQISAFYLPGDTKGVTRGSNLKKMGQRDSNTGRTARPTHWCLRNIHAKNGQ